MAVKGVLYDSAKLPLMKEGQTVMLLNVILKNDMGKSIVLTNRSKVLKTGPLEVPAALIKQGKDIACPPPAAEVDIKTVQTSPIKTLVTLRGQVVSVSIILIFCFVLNKCSNILIHVYPLVEIFS